MNNIHYIASAGAIEAPTPRRQPPLAWVIAIAAMVFFNLGLAAGLTIVGLSQAPGAQ